MQVVEKREPVVGADHFIFEIAVFDVFTGLG